MYLMLKYYYFRKLIFYKIKYKYKINKYGYDYVI